MTSKAARRQERREHQAALRASWDANQVLRKAARKAAADAALEAAEERRREERRERLRVEREASAAEHARWEAEQAELRRAREAHAMLARRREQIALDLTDGEYGELQAARQELLTLLARFGQRQEPARPRCRILGGRLGLLMLMATACGASMPDLDADPERW